MCYGGILIIKKYITVCSIRDYIFFKTHRLFRSSVRTLHSYWREISSILIIIIVTTCGKALNIKSSLILERCILKNFLYFIWKTLVVSARTVLTLLAMCKIKALLILIPKAFPLFILIITPFFYAFAWIELFMVFYLLFINRWYIGFIRNYSIFTYKILNVQMYMPHDFFLDIFFFVSCRLFSVSVWYNFKFFIFILIIGPFTTLVIISATLITISFLFSFYIIVCRLWDNLFMLHDSKTLGRIVDWDADVSKYLNLNVFNLLHVIGHDTAIIFWYYKLHFFCRRSVYYHDLPLWEKILIFWKLYFKITNRRANFFWFTLNIFYLSLYKTIFFTNWSKYPLNKFLKLFFYKLNYYLIEDLLYTIRYMVILYGFKNITVECGRLII